MSKIFVRHRRHVGQGAGRPRFTVVAVEGAHLKFLKPRVRRSELEKSFGRPDPGALGKDVGHLLKTILGTARSGRIHSDDHPGYRRPIRRLGAHIDHRVTPGSARRNRGNDLWEVNLLDLLIRHSNANHRRETIAWSKRRQGSAERLAILLVWRNYMKGSSEKVRGSPTPAMLRGMADQPLELTEILRQRLFRTRIRLPERWSEYYAGTVRTRALSNNRLHELNYAY